MLKLLESGVSSRSAALQQWIETAASLSEWFIQPQRLHIYADVVEPYLLGIAKVLLSTVLNSLFIIFNCEKHLNPVNSKSNK